MDSSKINLLKLLIFVLKKIIFENIYLMLHPDFQKKEKNIIIIITNIVSHCYINVINVKWPIQLYLLLWIIWVK